VLAILNAYRGEFYVGEFHKTVEGRLVASSDGRVANAEALKDFASGVSGDSAGWTLLVRAHDKASLALREVLGGHLPWQIVEGTLLSAIARLGRRAALEGHLDLPGQLDACYIRRTDAELNWKE
jgi:tRNA A37 threonylcarbamoyladenosine modification protein TsaB